MTVLTKQREELTFLTVDPSMARGVEVRSTGSVDTGVPVLVHCWKESQLLTLCLCSLCLGCVLLQHIAVDEGSFDSGGHLAVVTSGSRRRNLITPFTITSQPLRGIDSRLGNCCRHKCSLKLTLPGTGAETKETTKAFRQTQ